MKEIILGNHIRKVPSVAVGCMRLSEKSKDEMNQVDLFVCNFKAQNRDNLVFEDVTVFVDATPHRSLVAWTHFDREIFQTCDQFVFF